MDSIMAFSIRKYKRGKVRLILFSSFNKSSATFAKTVTSRSTVSGELPHPHPPPPPSRKIPLPLPLVRVGVWIKLGLVLGLGATRRLPRNL